MGMHAYSACLLIQLSNKFRETEKEPAAPVSRSSGSLFCGSLAASDARRRFTPRPASGTRPRPS